MPPDPEPATGPTAPAGTLQERALHAIKRRILMTEYPAGSALSEETLAAELGMSRTPVRQALHALVDQGLLERLPWRGVVVRRIDARKMYDIVEMQQCLLEWCVPRLCADEHLDLAPVLEAYERQVEGTKRGDRLEIMFEARKMDIALVSLSGNDEMARVMREISDLLVHAASQALSTFETLERAVAEHKRIIDAIQAKDADLALEAVRRHGDGIRRRLSGADQRKVEAHAKR